VLLFHCFLHWCSSCCRRCSLPLEPSMVLRPERPCCHWPWLSTSILILGLMCENLKTVRRYMWSLGSRGRLDVHPLKKYSTAGKKPTTVRWEKLTYFFGLVHDQRKRAVVFYCLALRPVWCWAFSLLLSFTPALTIQCYPVWSLIFLSTIC